jgi:hypothetical protein
VAHEELFELRRIHDDLVTPGSTAE